AEQMHHSLDKLRALDDDTLVLCAHEYTLDNCRFAQQVEPDNRSLQNWTEEVEKLRDAGEITLPVRLGHERAINPFLRVHEPSVIRAANQREPGTGDDPAAVFAVIRRWKDRF
ncbi:MAG TPA: hydroxyacylglutathione hydrolase C-terminal domain-containing protein, partial [Wenzhouxiangella sp.]|nr:hydroxyacylglutathione hydrolase C-terminal domain-containing protein [Wenzhouxiangella sp.]